MKQRLLYFLKEYKILLYLTLLIIIGIILWFNSKNFKEFGLNFTTEIIGVVITILIVDRLAVKREAERLLPMKMVVYKETSLLFNRFLSLIFGLYSHTIEENPPKNTKEFLESNLMRKAFIYTDINAKANTTQRENIIINIANQAKDLIQRAEKILDKYSIFLEPEMANLIHTCFIENVFISTLPHTQHTIQLRKNLPYPESLIFHIHELREEDIVSFVRLYDLLVTEREIHSKIDNNIRVLSSPEYIGKQKNRVLNYRIDEDKLSSQLENFNRWRNEQTGNKTSANSGSSQITDD